MDKTDLRRTSAIIAALMTCVAASPTPGWTKPASAEECAGVALDAPIEPSLTDSEKKLLCGDPATDAWRNIPPFQARYFVEIFLQERGYHQPKIAERAGVLHVSPGTRLTATELTAPGAPEFLEPERLRKTVGQPLTPKLLDRIENWSRAEFEAEGYPCPKLQANANTGTGAITLTTEPGPRQTITLIQENPVPGLGPGILGRYHAFHLGGPYNGHLLTVTENRVIAEGLVEGYNLSAECGPDGAIIRQRAVAGPPRLLRVGFGVNTEGLLLTRASWRNSRLGSTGSSAEVTLRASAIEQRIDAALYWYHLPFPSRRNIRPIARIRHINEQFFETLEVRGQLAYATTWDWQNAGGSLLSGPAMTGFRTYRGVSQGNTQFLGLDTSVLVKSHRMELFATSPRDGYLLQADVSFSDRQLLSSATVSRYMLSWELLWNVHDYEPPLLIAGLRGGVATTVLGEEESGFANIPANYLHYLGGSTSLRGFGRRELPSSGIGGLSSAFAGLELRLGQTPLAGVDPLVFLDAGATGVNSFDLDRALYWSPGAGVRWASPAGVVRATVARGYVHNSSGTTPLHWQFYLGLGEEF